MDTSSPEFQAALRDHARSLGVDPDAESHLLALVQEALLADVPAGWEQGETEDGTLYYFNEDSGESIWEHPLDAHYRELVKQKKAEGPPAKVVEANAEAAPPPAASSEVSKLEVYSFDDDSDDDVKPPSKQATSTTTASDKSSRLSSLFTPQPAPSYSGVSTASSSTTSAKDAFPASTRASALSGGGVSSSTASSNSTGGFGRDRSWLLDNDDDDIPTLGSSRRQQTPATVSSSSSFIKPTEIQDLSSSTSSSSSSSRPGTATASSMSYTSRLFGGPSSSSTPATTPSETTVTSLDLGSGNSTTGTSGKLSPRRGIASAIKGPFFQDLAAAPGAAIEPSSSLLGNSTSPGSTSSAADAAKIKDLEKTTSDLSKQVDQLKKELETTKQQLETAKQDAKEANYLKMKANESKTKLSEKEGELTKAKQETTKLQDQVQRLQDECATLKQVQKTATQQEVLDAKKATSELEALLATSKRQTAEAEDALQKSRVECEKLESQLKETISSLEREKKDTALLKDQYNNEQKETRGLRDQVEKAKQDAQEQIEKVKREMSEQSRKLESLTLLQETMDRQGKYVLELEEKQKGLLTKVSEAEAKEAQATRETKLKDLEVQDAGRKVVAMTLELEARDKQLRELMDKLRHEQSHASEIQSKALSLQRSEDEFDRKKQLLEREKQELVAQLRERGDQLHALQSQLQRAQEEHVGAASKLQMEIHTLGSQLKQLKSQELLPLEKQRDQLTHEGERVREKLAGVEKELRTAQQELTTETSRNHQLQVEIEAWKRKEQQQKTQKETYLQEKMSTEKQLQSLQAECSTYKHDKRLEIEKLAFRLRELESQVAQKDYDIVRVEEKFTKAEAWRLKEARRVEERDTQLLDLKEELAQLKSRNIEAENNLIIHELRREKEQLDDKLRALAQDLEEERTARAVAAQKFQDEAENLQKAIEWQLPQLAAACVNRSSEEWTRKCHEIVKALQDDWSLKALTERNELVQRLKEVDERRDHVEQKLKNAVAECEFLRKEVHRVEDNNKVLLDQLHTIRVYMMQRGGASVFPSAFATTTAPPSNPPPPPPPPQPQQPPQPMYSDFAAVNQLNSQLAVLHSQFQQLFDAHADPPHRSGGASTRSMYSPSERFEIPSSPPSQPRNRKTRADPLNTSLASTGSSCSSSSSIDETLDALLLRKSSGSLSATRKDPHKEKEELLATLEAIGEDSVSGGSPLSLASVAPLVSMGAGDASDTMWYQKNYWRTKYKH